MVTSTPSFYGKICAMERITEICRDNDLKLIEDCAQAHGASYKGVKAGSFGDGIVPHDDAMAATSTRAKAG